MPYGFTGAPPTAAEEVMRIGVDAHGNSAQLIARTQRSRRVEATDIFGALVFTVIYFGMLGLVLFAIVDYSMAYLGL